MNLADLILYPAKDLPEKLVKLNSEQCLKFLMPYLQGCRKTGRISSAVAEIDFVDGSVAWFAAEEGKIDFHRERPRFGIKRINIGFIPMPMKTMTINKASDEMIETAILEAFQNPEKI